MNYDKNSKQHLLDYLTIDHGLIYNIQNHMVFSYQKMYEVVTMLELGVKYSSWGPLLLSQDFDVFSIHPEACQGCSGHDLCLYRFKGKLFDFFIFTLEQIIVFM